MHRFAAAPLDRRVAELAGRQWGVVSLAHLRAAGLSYDAVRSRVRAGRLHRLHHGVYAVGHTVLKREGRWLAAVLACGDGAVLSHRSAAAHWGLLRSEATRTDVTTPARRAANATIRPHISRFLIARDTTTHQDIPITSVPRTLLDLAAPSNRTGWSAPLRRRSTSSSTTTRLSPTYWHARTGTEDRKR
jgi:predicted transcriptional regulator of viral defense system